MCIVAQMQEPAALLEQQLGVERLGGSGDTGVFLVRSGQDHVATCMVQELCPKLKL